MNEQIKKLYEQSFVRDNYVNMGPDGPALGFKFDPEKFAELIVRDCRDMFVVNSPSWNLLNEKLEHFGVEE